MIPSIQIPLSGLQSAEKRILNSATAIANSTIAFTTSPEKFSADPLLPPSVTQKNLAEGGVSTEFLPINPAYIQGLDLQKTEESYEGGGNASSYPTADIASEIADQIAASAQFKANVRVFKTIDELQNVLLKTGTNIDIVG